MRHFLDKLTRSPEGEGNGGGDPPPAEGDGADIGSIVTNTPPGQEAPSADAKAGDLKSQQARNNGLFKKEGDPEPTNKAETPDDGRPEGLPDKFWNAKDKTLKADDLVKSYSELEKQYGKLLRTKSIGGEVPEKAEDYFKDSPIELPKEVNRLSLAADDPGLKAWADACKKHGLGKDIARALAVDMFVSMNDYAPEPMDPERERQALGKEGPAIADGLWGWAESMEGSGALNGDDVDVFEDLMGSAKGIRFLAKLRGMTGLEPLPVNVGEGVQGMSPAEWQHAMAAAIKSKDYKEQARLEKMGENINGTHAAGASRNGSIGFAG